MQIRLIAACSLLLSTAVFAADRGKLIFEDDFERDESQETRDEIGKGWGSNSRTRAKGNKQVDLRDGALYIYLHQEADHAVSVTHPAEFWDGSVELKFMLENSRDVLGLDFADLKFKDVHAGHLFKVTVNPRNVLIDDMKTGGMNMKFYAAKKARKLTAEQKKFIASARKTFPNKLATGQWHGLLVDIAGATVSVDIDGRRVGAFSSPGFAHPTKRMLRLSVPRQAVVDDVKIYARSGGRR